MENRKEFPLATGLLDYFPDALLEVSHTSFVGNEQHNPGQPLHWAKEKSTDHADCLLRHLKDRGKRDTDGVRHTAKVAWRALALLQTELEHEATNNNEVITLSPDGAPRDGQWVQDSTTGVWWRWNALTSTWVSRS